MKPQYLFPLAIIPALVLAALKNNTRSFRHDSKYLVTKICPPVEFICNPIISQKKPLLITVNHYSHPGFSIMWAVIAISSYIPVDVHWIMTNTWDYRSPIPNMVLKPFNHMILSEIARIYNFSIHASYCGRCGQSRNVYTQIV